MAGHSKFKKIKHKKAANDSKRSKDYSRAAREITVAARLGGGDPKSNPRLRMAILAAKKVNFPKAKVEDAIKKGVSPNEGEALEEVRHEGFGPGGVAMMIDTVTVAKQAKIDKAMMKKTFTYHGGSLGENGCVAHLFQRLGLITYPADVKSEDDMLELAAEYGADDCQKVEDEFEILCSFENLHSIKEGMEKIVGEASSARIIWKPTTPVILDHKKTKTVLDFIDVLEDLEGVQDVWSNLEIPDDYNPDQV